MDYQALRLLGSAALAKAARGEGDAAGLSVLKVFGSEAEQNAYRHVLEATGADGLADPAMTAPYYPYSPGHSPRVVHALHRQFRGHHRRWDVGDPAQHHRPAGVGSAGALICQWASFSIECMFDWRNRRWSRRYLGSSG